MSNRLLADLLAHEDLAELSGRDGGRFALLADQQVKYNVGEQHRTENADDYATYLDTRIWRNGRWVTRKPRVTCGCGKTVAQRLDGQPWAHTCTEVAR